MSTILQLTPHDPLIARDGRPFGVGQGNQMRGLPWPLPSVVAGSFRTALVKAGSGDFSGDIPQRLMQIAVAGVFPVHGGEFYLPAPNDCVWDDKTNKVHRVQPTALDAGEGVDFPADCAGLCPVRLSDEQSQDDFKVKPTPAWWPLSKLAEWLTSSEIKFKPDWFTDMFLQTPFAFTRDHVVIESGTGAAKEGEIFSSVGLHVSHLPKYGAGAEGKFADRFAEVTLTARITIEDPKFDHAKSLDILHPLGGERRLVHWQKQGEEITGWNCPARIRSALATTTKVRMVLATPAVYKDGWKPGWLTTGLKGDLSGVKLKLVGASNGRWKAVSGWSLADTEKQKRGPKPIRRMVPAGSVYFFEVEKPGDAAPMADLWLQSVSDDPQEQRDGFGLATWGTW